MGARAEDGGVRRPVPSTVPGLELRVRPRETWTPGHKVDVLYRGELRPRLAVERARAEQEKERAEQEKARAEQEKARADALEARLRELAAHDSDAD